MFIFTCMYLCLACVYRCPQKPEEGVRTPRDGLTGGCESPDMDAGNWTGRTANAFNKWGFTLTMHVHLFFGILFMKAP